MDIDVVARVQGDNLLLAAAALSARAQFVVVGGCAFRLRGGDRVPPDLDLVPEPSVANLHRLFDGVAALGTVGRVRRPSDHVFATGDVVTRTTSVGVIDVLLARGREDYGGLFGRATAIPVRGHAVRVAAIRDVIEMRVRFGKVMIDA